MLLVTTAIIPVVSLLVLGAVLRRKFLVDSGFWGGMEWLSYKVFTPALFISSIAGTDLSIVPVGPLLLSVGVPIAAIAAFVIGSARMLRTNGPRLTSLVQGAVRINTYVGLTFAGALHGQEGVATFALASAVVVPLVNVICVGTLSAYGDKLALVRRRPLWRELLENPLIQSCALGLLLNLADLPLPEFVSAALTMLAAPALACGTLIAGAALHADIRWRDTADIAAVSLLKLVVLPLSAAAIAIPLGAAGAGLSSIVLICAIPTAPSAYVLASRMGGDVRLMAAITGTQTVLAMGTLPVVLMLVDLMKARF